MVKTHKQFVEEVSNISPTITVVGMYTKSTDRIDVICNACGLHWSPKAYSLTQGKGCPHCSAKRGALVNTGKTKLKTHDEFLCDLANVNSSVIVLSTYISNHIKIDCKCGICGHQWSAMPYSLLQNHGCPRCAKSGTSFMEQFILTAFERILGKESVLSRDKSTIGMELDILIPNHKFAIEPGSWTLHKRSLPRDRRKREQCALHNIRLITIYDMYPENCAPPFENDCITYCYDLNKADRQVIIDLVKTLLSFIKIECFLSQEEWDSIEEIAYQNSKAKTHDDFVRELRHINPNIQVIGKYENSNKRILVKCLTCGYEWEGVPANMLSGDGCRKCGTQKSHEKFIKSQEKFVNELGQINPTVQVIGSYQGRHNPVKVKCSICGFVWEPTASSLLRGSTHKGAKSIHKSKSI